MIPSPPPVIIMNPSHFFKTFGSLNSSAFGPVLAEPSGDHGSWYGAKLTLALILRESG
jgi:hypothetical protein